MALLLMGLVMLNAPTLPVPVGPIVLSEMGACLGGGGLPDTYVEGYDTNGNGDFEWLVVGALRLDLERPVQVPVVVVKYLGPTEKEVERVWIKARDGTVRVLTFPEFQAEGRHLCEYIVPFFLDAV